MTRVLGVHGIGNHRPALSALEAGDGLTRAWRKPIDASLGGRARGIDLSVAYYAPMLGRPDVAQSGITPESLEVGARQALLDWVAALGAPPEVSQGPLTQPIRQAMSWIARRFGLDSRLVEGFVLLFCREVHRYLETVDGAARLAARDAVAAAVEAHAPVVVIAHSLGSVVTYEALWARPDLEVDLLVTLGSPLAMPDVVFDRLSPAPDRGKGSRPPGVRRWVNIADRGDLVAVPRWLGQSFVGVDDDLEGVIAPFDFHRVRNYLASPTLAGVLGPYL